MNIATVKNGVVIDSYVFDEMETAQQFFKDGVLGDADIIIELPEEHGIGDYYKDGKWNKKEVSEPESGPEPYDPPIDDITALQIAVTELYEIMLGGVTNG